MCQKSYLLDFLKVFEGCSGFVRELFLDLKSPFWGVFSARKVDNCPRKSRLFVKIWPFWDLVFDHFWCQRSPLPSFPKIGGRWVVTGGRWEVGDDWWEVTGGRLEVRGRWWGEAAYRLRPFTHHLQILSYSCRSLCVFDGLMQNVLVWALPLLLDLLLWGSTPRGFS